MLPQIVAEDAGVLDLSVGALKFSERMLPFFHIPSAAYDQSSQLKERVAHWFKAHEEEIAITTGASLGLLSSLSLLPKGSSIICMRPYYPSYPRLFELLDLKPIWVDAHYDDDELVAKICRAITPSTSGLLINTPLNPLGLVLNTFALSKISIAAQRSGCLLIIDETCRELCERSDPLSGLREYVHGENVVQIRSLSKSFGFAGERVGFVCAEKSMTRRIEKMHWSLALSPPAYGQQLAQSALSQAAVVFPSHARLVAERFDVAADLLRTSAKIKVYPRQGGMFLWAQVLNTRYSAGQLCNELLNSVRLKITPGEACGQNSGCFIRVNIGAVTSDVANAMTRLVSFVEGLS